MIRRRVTAGYTPEDLARQDRMGPSSYEWAEIPSQEEADPGGELAKQGYVYDPESGSMYRPQDLSRTDPRSPNYGIPETPTVITYPNQPGHGTKVGGTPGIGDVGGSSPGTGSGTGGGSTSANGNRDALARLRQLIASYGLPASLGDWAWEQLQAGAGEDEVSLGIRDRPEFKARFPAIDARVKAGLAPLSPAEYIQYERQYRQLAMQAGLPPGFYDDPSDTTDFLVKDVSIAELSQRIQNGYLAIKTADPSVRSEFTRLFGADGDAALASYVLDPSRSTAALEKIVSASQAAGAGWRYGMQLSKDQAVALGDRGLSAQGFEQGFSQLNTIRGLFNETASETQHLGWQDTGLAAVFGSDNNARDQIAGKLQQRRNFDRSGGFGAASDQRGAYGVGTAT